MSIRPTVRVRSDDRVSRAVLGAFVAVFASFAASQMIRPALATWRADRWVATPCRSEERRVGKEC